jgi:hypothetical protein
VKPVSLRDYLNDPDSAKHRVVFERRDTRCPHDPWKLRDEFLSCPPEEWKNFVEYTGHFGTFRLSKNDFAEWQQLIREALLLHPRDWKTLESRFPQNKVLRLYRALILGFAWNEKVPTAQVRTNQTLDAIIATIQLDILSGVQFKVCARADCLNPPFKIETRHKIYCSSECAHLVAVRTSRARAAKNKSSRQQSARKPKLRG